MAGKLLKSGHLCKVYILENFKNATNFSPCNCPQQNLNLNEKENFLFETINSWNKTEKTNNENSAKGLSTTLLTATLSYLAFSLSHFDKLWM